MNWKENEPLVIRNVKAVIMKDFTVTWAENCLKCKGIEISNAKYILIE